MTTRRHRFTAALTTAFVLGALALPIALAPAAATTLHQAPLSSLDATAVTHYSSSGEEHTFATAASPNGTHIAAGGRHKGSSTLGSGGAAVTLPWIAGSMHDAFVAVWDANRNLLWARHAGGWGDDQVSDVSIDDAGNVFALVSNPSATITFDDPAATSRAAGTHVAKYSPTGDLLWVIQPSANAASSVMALTVDNAGGVFAAGSFSGTTEFGAGANAVTKISAGGRDAYVTRLNADGSLAWAARGGGTQDDFATDIALAPDGGVALAGTFRGAASFKSSNAWTTRSLTAVGAADLFVVRYGPNGALPWVSSAGGVAVWPRAVAVGPDSRVHVVGEFGSSVAFGATTLVTSGPYDGFLWSLDNAGSSLWAHRAGGTSYEALQSVAVTAANQVVVAGYISSAGTIGTEPLALPVMNDPYCCAPQAAGYLAAFDTAGVPRWSSVTHYTTSLSGGPILGSVVAIAGGGVILGGSANTSGRAATFGEGTDAPTIVGTKYSDIVLAAYAPVTPTAAVNPSCARVAMIGSRSPSTSSYVAQVLVGDPAGPLTPITTSGSPTYGPYWSPDGRHLAWFEHVAAESAFKLMVSPADGSPPVPVATIGNADTPQGGLWLTWNSDGTKVAWVARWNGNPALLVAPADGSGPPAPVSLADNAPPAFTTGPSNRIAFTRTVGGIASMWIADLDAPGVVVKASTNTGVVRNTPAWSTDGGRLAFVENRSGVVGITVRDVPLAPGPGLFFSVPGRVDPVRPFWNEAGTRVAWTDKPVSESQAPQGWSASVVPPGTPVQVPQAANAWGIEVTGYAPDDRVSWIEPPDTSGPWFAGDEYRVAAGFSTAAVATRVTPRSPFTYQASRGAGFSPDGQFFAFRGNHGSFIGDVNGVAGLRLFAPGLGSSIKWSPLSGGADLGVTGTVPPGPVAGGTAYPISLTVSNNGLCGATGVVVDSAIPTGLEVVSVAASQGSLDGTSTSWNVGSLADGATATLTVQVRAAGPATVGSRPAVHGAGRDGNLANNTVDLSTVISAPDVAWAKSHGGTGKDDATGVAVDSAGNSYVAGSFAASMTLGSGPGSVTFTSAGQHDGYLAKLDPAGALVWARQIGGTGEDNALDVALDPTTGDPIVTGGYSGTAAFGATPQTAAGGEDAFVARYSPAGALIWVRSAGGAGGDRAQGIAVDVTGASYVVGTYSGAPATFGSEPTATVLTPAGYLDSFVTRFDSAGANEWARAVAGADTDILRSVTITGGNAAVVGFFGGATTVGGGGPVLTSSGSMDVVVATFDPAGTSVDARRIGGAGPELAWDITGDGAAGSLITGAFGGVVAVGSGVTLTSAGDADGYVLRLGANLATVFGWRFGGVNGDAGTAIALDGANVIVSGFHRGPVTIGTATPPDGSLDDGFVTSWSLPGVPRWVRPAPTGNGNDYPLALAVGPGGAIWVAGHFAGTAAVGSTAGGQLTSAGNDDGFIARFG